MDTSYPGQSEMVEQHAATLARRRRKRLLRGAVIGAVAAGGLALFGHWVYGRFTHVYVDDARIAADVISVSSRVAGWVTDLRVAEGDVIRTGDVLVAIDARDATLRLAELDARLKSLESERARLEAERQMVDEQTRSLYAMRNSQLVAARASLAGRKSDLDLARTDFERAAKLLQRKVVSRQRWEEKRAVFSGAEQAFQKARAEVSAANASLIEAQANRQKLQVIDRQLAALTHQREEIRAQRDRQELDLRDRAIRSPIDGVVDKTFVNSSEYVSPGQRLLMVHNPKEVWVAANVRETDLRRLQIGAAARVAVDAFPDEQFGGRITRIGNAATSEFALLPTPNPSGNFTKIAQRIAIRIALDAPTEKLRPGMMVEVDIGIVDN